jgi:hypothetical protein
MGSHLFYCRLSDPTYGLRESRQILCYTIYLVRIAKPVPEKTFA